MFKMLKIKKSNWKVCTVTKIQIAP